MADIPEPPSTPSVTAIQLTDSIKSKLEKKGFKLTFEDQDGNEISPAADMIRAICEALVEELPKAVVVQLTATATVTTLGTPAPVVGNGTLLIP